MTELSKSEREQIRQKAKLPLTIQLLDTCDALEARVAENDTHDFNYWLAIVEERDQLRRERDAALLRDLWMAACGKLG